MASQQQLKELVSTKELQLQSIYQKISSLVLQICKLSLKFYKEDAKIHRKIVKVQFSRPRGNPANQWPHSPMTSRVRAFYQIKEQKETELRQTQALLKQTFHHNKAILINQRQELANAQSNIESQIRLLKIQLHWPSKTLFSLIFL